jgi:nucleoside-diphosphate-sugar epimerase
MILITGGNGFIGSEFTLLIKKKYRKEKVFLLSQPKYDLVTGKNLGKIPQNPRLIIHLAASTDTAKRDQSCNDTGTANLVRHLSKIGPNTHLIYTSSLAVYSGRAGTDKPIDEKTIPVPSDAYGNTKLKAENVLIEAANEQGFKLTIVRFPTVWGDNPRKNAFLNFLKDLVKKNSIFSRLNWPGKTGLINVTDAAKFLVKVAQKAPKEVEVRPIAVENLTLAEIFKILTISNGKKYNQIKIPNFVWNTASFLSKYLKYFEYLMPISLYNLFWRASIVVGSPLWCRVNAKGRKFTA